MKLISLNIELGLHNDLVLPFLKKENADVICLQELLEEEFEFYKKELNLEGVFSLRNITKTPVHTKLNGKKYCVAIFAKNIIDSGSIFYNGKEENLFKPIDEYLNNEYLRKNSSLIWANVKDENGVVYKIITTHLPVTKEGESSPYQLEVVDKLLNAIQPIGELVLCGDMNAPRGRETFRRLANKYKDNIPLEYKTSIDNNIHRVKDIPPYVVDGLFTTPTYQVSNVKLVDGVSDHMAIVAQINKI